MRHKGTIDVRHVNAYGRPEEANLGVADPSWYYVDDRGNKIWVRNLTLDSAISNSYMKPGAKTGAFSEAAFEDGREIVVKIPAVKRHFTLAEDYYQKCVDLDASLAQRTMTTHAAPPSSAGASVRGAASSRHRFDAAQNNNNRGESTTKGDVAAYIASQKDLAVSLARGVQQGTQAGYVFRPPATVDEAEERLRQLREEEAALEAQLLKRQQRDQYAY